MIINAPFFLKTSNYPITFCAFLLYESVKVQTIFFAAAFIFYKKLTTPFLQTKIIIKQIKKILRLVFFYKNKTLIQVWPGAFKNFFPDMQKKVKRNAYVTAYIWQYFFRLIRQFYLRFFMVVVKGSVTKLKAQLKKFLFNYPFNKQIQFIIFQKNKAYSRMRTKQQGRVKRKIRKKFLNVFCRFIAYYFNTPLFFY